MHDTSIIYDDLDIYTIMESFEDVKSYGDFEDVKKWVKDKLWEEWLPQPAEIYFKSKGQFKGIFFCRFDSVEDRDKVVAHIRSLFLKIENDKVWSNPDLPIEVRTPEIFLFAVKKLMASTD